MSLELYDLRLESVDRPLDWRWRRALKHDVLKLSRRRDDEWVWQARRFQQAFQACGGPVDFYDLAWRFGPVHDAYRQYETRLTPGYTPGEMRQDKRPELEARLLSGQDFKAIGERLCLKAETVEAYEKLFFNVLDRMSSRSWVSHAVFGQSVWAGLHAREYEIFWKLAAYVQGPEYLEWWIDLEKKPPPTEGRHRAVTDERARDELSRQSYVAAKSLVVNSHTQTLIMDLWLKTKALETQAGEDSQTQLLHNVQGLLESVPWRAARAVRDGESRPGLSAAEPRSAETLRALPPADADVRFPEPKVVNP